jgi:hypothetical protein
LSQKLLTFAEPSEEAMSDITILNFDKDGVLVGKPSVLGPEVADVVLIAHGWNEGPDIARGHYQDLVNLLEVILSQNKTQWQGHTVAYFGVIWPSSKYADDLKVINMRVDAGDPPPHAGVVAGLPAAPPLNDADLQARAQDVAQFLGIDPDLLATQALQAAGDNGARDALVSTLQKATSERRRLRADEQTRAESLRRSVGITQVLRWRSISVHLAPITSPVRSPVSSVTSRALAAMRCGWMRRSRF